MYESHESQFVEVLETSRDMDQSPLVNLTAQQKIAIAKQNSNIGINYSEAGFPESNPADRKVYSYFRDNPLEGTRLAAFGATRRKSLMAEKDPGLQALLQCGAPALVLVGKSSRHQAEIVLNVSAEENLQMIRDTFAYLQSKGIQDLTFDAEHFFDGYALDQDYSLAALQAAIENGANRVVLCDTKGGALPHTIAQVTEDTLKAIGRKDVRFGVHMHNDGDMATANTIAAVQAGARHVQGTWFGLGERVGNADLTAVIPNLHRIGYETSIHLPNLTETAHRIAGILQYRMAKNTPFVGADAFAHKAGQHVRGNIRDPMANQFIPPESVGNASRSILSKQSGMGNIDDFIARTSILPTKIKRELLKTENKEQMLTFLKEEESKGIKYRDAEASFLIRCLEMLQLFEPHFDVKEYEFVDSSSHGAQTTLKIRVNGNSEYSLYEGKSKHGVVDALKISFVKALSDQFPEVSNLHLINYEVHKLPDDEDTASDVQVVIEFSDGSEYFYTTGVGADILAASCSAMSDAIHYRILKKDITSEIVEPLAIGIE